MNERSENMEFEAEVRRVAEAIWGLAPGDCQPVHYDGVKGVSEVDGIARTRDVTHIIMATVSRKLDKAKSDTRKLDIAESKERSSQPVLLTKKWLITKYQLDAEHINHAKKSGVEVKTLDQFRRMFFDGHSYITKRRNGVFGSARNLGDDSPTVPDNEYIEPEMIAEKVDLGGRIRSERITLHKIIDMVSEGETVILTAPFGSGKSMSMQRIFNRLSEKSLRDNGLTPIALNLREHWGQSYPDEMMERHARSIGFVPKEHVNIAWRAGMAHILLDGFDEIAGQAIARVGDANFMREARVRALEGVRGILQSCGSSSGVVIAGRDHYFDDIKEMSNSLGVGLRKYTIVKIEEFNEHQANEYLKRKGVDYKLPEWLPRKPLLLGYLAHNELLREVIEIESSLGFGYAWDRFLDLICKREASLEKGSIEPETLRRILERLSIDVRSSSSGNGPIYGKDLSDAYFREVGYAPDERVVMQLQRLPGLTQRDHDKGARSFVDIDMLSALQGSYIANLILGQSDDVDDRNWQAGLGPRAIETAIHILSVKTQQDISGILPLIVSTCKRLSRDSDINQKGMNILADCVSIGIAASKDIESGMSFAGTTVDGACFEYLNMEAIDISGLVLRNCIIREIYIDPGIQNSSITFERCAISRVVGATNLDSLPKGNFIDCSVEGFDEFSSNAAISRSNLPTRIKALATVLRKMFIQYGNGRKLNAFKRGVDRSLVDEIDVVLDYLRSKGYIFIHNDVAYPKREFMQRINVILRELQHSKDEIVTEIMEI